MAKRGIRSGAISAHLDAVDHPVHGEQIPGIALGLAAPLLGTHKTLERDDVVAATDMDLRTRVSGSISSTRPRASRTSSSLSSSGGSTASEFTTSRHPGSTTRARRRRACASCCSPPLQRDHSVADRNLDVAVAPRSNVAQHFHPATGQGADRALPELGLCSRNAQTESRIAPSPLRSAVSRATGLPRRARRPPPRHAQGEFLRRDALDLALENDDAVGVTDLDRMAVDVDLLVIFERLAHQLDDPSLSAWSAPSRCAFVKSGDNDPCCGRPRSPHSLRLGVPQRSSVTAFSRLQASRAAGLRPILCVRPRLRGALLRIVPEQGAAFAIRFIRPGKRNCRHCRTRLPFGLPMSVARPRRGILEHS